MLQHHADDHSEAAHFNDAVASCGDLFQALQHVGPDLGRVFHHVLFIERIEHRQRSRARDRIPAEGGAVASRRECARDFRFCDHRTDGKPAAQRLRQGNNVRFDAGVFVGEKFSGAAHPDLHLIEDQQQVRAIA